MIEVSFENRVMTVEPLEAQQILAGLLERGAKIFRCESEDIALQSKGAVVTIAGDFQQMGAIWQFCQAALNGLLQNDWREAGSSIEQHLCWMRQQEELVHEFY